MSERHRKPTEWLDREDRTERAGRRERLEWIAGLMPDAEYLGFPGGLLSKFHFDEMRYCFVYGQFLAVVLLGLAYIERTLAAHFYGAGQDELKRASMAKLLQCAV